MEYGELAGVHLLLPDLSVTPGLLLNHSSEGTMKNSEKCLFKQNFTLAYQLPNNIKNVGNVTIKGQQHFRKCITHGIVPGKHQSYRPMGK